MEWQKLSNFWKSSILFSPNNTTHIMRLQMCCPFTVTWQSQILMLGCWCVNFVFSFRCVIFRLSFRCFLWDRRIDLKLSLLSEILYKSVSDFEQVKPFERPLWEPEQDYLTSPLSYNPCRDQDKISAYRLSHWPQWWEDQTQRVFWARNSFWNVSVVLSIDWESPESRKCCSSQPHLGRKAEGWSLPLLYSFPGIGGITLHNVWIIKDIYSLQRTTHSYLISQ